jgi:DNA-binding transcriptional regulator YiaG
LGAASRRPSVKSSLERDRRTDDDEPFDRAILPMPDRFVRLARTRLDLTDLDLARKLGVSVGCLRSWDRKGAPRYVQLALCALIAGIEPEAVEGSPTPAPRNPKAHLPAE